MILFWTREDHQTTRQRSNGSRRFAYTFLWGRGNGMPLASMGEEPVGPQTGAAHGHDTTREIATTRFTTQHAENEVVGTPTMTRAAGAHLVFFHASCATF